MNSDHLEAVQSRIATARAALDTMEREDPRLFSAAKIDLREAFESSLTVEPDGAGLSCILQAAREMMIPL